jgi:hypothetical protein
MTLDVHYTADDYREAAAAVRAQGLQSISTLPVFYVFLAFSIGTILGNILERQPPGAPLRGPVEVVLSSLPLLIVAAYWGFVALRTRGKKAHGFVIPPPKLSGLGVALPLFLCIVMFAVAVLAGALMPVVPVDAAPNPPRLPLGTALATVALPFMPSIVFAIFSIILVLRFFRRNITRAFELQINLHRPTTIQIAADSLTVSDDTHQTRYSWPAFIGWHETANLFLLYRSYISFVMIPKRTFSSPEALYQFVELVRHAIGDQRRGFEALLPPLLPMAPSIPPPLRPRS